MRLSDIKGVQAFFEKPAFLTSLVTLTQLPYEFVVYSLEFIESNEDTVEERSSWGIEAGCIPLHPRAASVTFNPVSLYELDKAVKTLCYVDDLVEHQVYAVVQNSCMQVQISKNIFTLIDDEIDMKTLVILFKKYRELVIHQRVHDRLKPLFEKHRLQYCTNLDTGMGSVQKLYSYQQREFHERPFLSYQDLIRVSTFLETTINDKVCRIFRALNGRKLVTVEHILVMCTILQAYKVSSYKKFSVWKKFVKRLPLTIKRESKLTGSAHSPNSKLVVANLKKIKKLTSTQKGG